jgi:hypothetical protein
MMKGKLLFDSEEDFDLEELTRIMLDKNSSKIWEAEVINFGWKRERGIKKKFTAEDGKDLLGRVLPPMDCIFKIYELDKKGFAIQNFHHDNNTGNEWYHILPACEEEYHRDWKRDGICVKD